MPDATFTAIAIAIIILVAYAVIATGAWGAIRGAPWVPTRRSDLDRILALAVSRPGMRVADLGCGTGHVLAAFARAGCTVAGWELALLPWVIARWRLRRSPISRVMYGDFWNADLSGFDLVYGFLMPKTNARLAEKLARELQPGARVLTYAFPIPGWTPDTIDRSFGEISIYAYTIPHLRTGGGSVERAGVGVAAGPVLS